MYRWSLVSILAFFSIFSLSGLKVRAASVAGYIPASRRVAAVVNPNWKPAASNTSFAFLEITDPVSFNQKLKIKNLKTGQVKTLVDSNVVESISEIRDISPNAKTVVFEVSFKQGEEIISQTFVYSTAGEKIFTLTDGIARKSEQVTKLTGIKFHEDRVELAYHRADREEAEIKQVDLIANYSLISLIKNDQDAIAAFYGGSIPYGVKEITKLAEKNIYELSFDPKITSIKKHELTINQGVVTSFREYLDDAVTLSTRAEFVVAATERQNYIYNTKDALIYSGVSFDRASIDLVTLNKYLRAEVENFYQSKLDTKAQISVLGKKIFVNFTDARKYTKHTLQFAFAYNNFSECGFYSFSRQKPDLSEKETFVFSGKTGAMSFNKTTKGVSERLVFNQVDQFNFDYINTNVELINSSIEQAAKI